MDKKSLQELRYCVYIIQHEGLCCLYYSTRRICLDEDIINMIKREVMIRIFEF